MPHIKDQELLDRPYRFYVKRHWRMVALGTLWLFLTNLMDSLVPRLTGMTVDRIKGEQPLSSIGEVILWMIVVIVLMSAFRFLWRFYWATFHHTVAEDLRNRLYAGMADLGPTFFRPRKQPHPEAAGMHR